jgi:hypothetical protein
MTTEMGAAARCAGCGAALAPDAQWCGQCFLPRGDRALVHPVERSIVAGTNVLAAAAGPRPMMRTRWKKTPTTFGPVGRVLCTVALFVPLPLLIIGTVVSGGLEIVGLGVWVFVIMPWALRDIWKAGQLPAG